MPRWAAMWLVVMLRSPWSLNSSVALWMILSLVFIADPSAEPRGKVIEVESPFAARDKLFGNFKLAHYTTALTGSHTGPPYARQTP